MYMGLLGAQSDKYLIIIIVFRMIIKNNIIILNLRDIFQFLIILNPKKKIFLSNLKIVL